MKKGLSVADLRDLIVPYPTLSEVSKRAAVSFYAGQTRGPMVRRVLSPSARLRLSQRRGGPAAWLMRPRPRKRRLGVGSARACPSKLLVLTVVFVMLAEVLIYVPSIANFRRNWLNDRIAAAQIAALVLDAAPAGTVPQPLAHEPAAAGRRRHRGGALRWRRAPPAGGLRHAARGRARRRPARRDSCARP